MSPVLFWFRHDLRLHDQPALLQACSGGARYLVPVFCLPDLQAGSPWGFTRVGPHRRAWLVETLQDLAAQLAQRGCPLLSTRIRNGTPSSDVAMSARGRSFVSTITRLCVRRCDCWTAPAATSRIAATQPARPL